MLFAFCLLTFASLISLHSTLSQQTPDVPLRIVEAPRDQKVVENEVASFFCKVTGNTSDLEVFWRRNGQRVRNHGRYSTFSTEQTSVLRIEPVRSHDAATFQCVAQNSNTGRIETASAILEVYPAETAPDGYPQIVDSPTLKAVEKGRNTVMICSASGDPQPTIFWLKDFVPIDLEDPRLQLLSGGSLQIQNAQESDEGRYECVAENTVGTAYSYGANLYVRVRRVPPHFSILPESVEVMSGGSANLTCAAVGSPMPYVKWRLGNIQLTPEEAVPVGRNVLVLTDIRASANYICVAESTLGLIEAQAQVRVNAPLSITEAPRDQKVVDGDVASFFCKASGSPAPDIYWRKNGRRVTNSSERYTMYNMRRGSVLRVDPVNLRDVNATFACVAESDRTGEVETASARLEVYPASARPDGYPEILQGPTAKAVRPGRSVVMFCSSSGHPEPTVFWLKDAIPLDLDNPRIHLLSGGSLHVQRSHLTDEGSYECVAENSVGVAYSTPATLYVRNGRHFE